MKVKLPRRSTGQEIVEAFKAASNFEYTGGEFPGQWRAWVPMKQIAEETIGEFHYEPGSAKQVVESRGIKSTQYIGEKRFCYFGKFRWKSYIYSDIFTLAPVKLSEKYDEVEINACVYYGGIAWGWELKALDPNSERFVEMKPKLEKILRDFFARLS